MPVLLQRFLFLSSFACILSGQLEGQTLNSADPDLDSLSAYIQIKYGLDQELFNGFQYYKRYVMYRGDPFFPEDSFYKGSLAIGGIAYEDVRLKYNCFSQNLILEYTDFQKRYNQLILSNVHIDSFVLGDYRFQKLALFNEEPMFYQTFSSGPLSCYIHWSKNLLSTYNDLYFSHEYTRLSATIYVGYRGEFKTFTNRSSFISIFPESIHAEIKRYLRQKHVSFRIAGPDELQNLLVYVGQLIEFPLKP